MRYVMWIAECESSKSWTQIAALLRRHICWSVGNNSTQLRWKYLRISFDCLVMSFLLWGCCFTTTPPLAENLFIPRALWFFFSPSPLRRGGEKGHRSFSASLCCLLGESAGVFPTGACSWWLLGGRSFFFLFFFLLRGRGGGSPTNNVHRFRHNGTRCNGGELVVLFNSFRK